MGLSLANQLDGLVSLHVERVEGLAGQHHLLDRRDLDDHSGDFSAESELLLLGESLAIHVLQHLVNVGVDVGTDHVALRGLI